MMDALGRDARHAVRRLSKDWSFSIGAITILALGIGANTAVFSILNNTLFLPYPFANSGRLVNLYQNEAKSGEPEGVSYPAFLDLQSETAVFAGVAADNLTEGRYQIVDERGATGGVRPALFEYASANQLDVLGMRPFIGRWFSAEEERRGDPVAVLGWTMWTREFGSDPNVLGRTLIAGGTAVQVIGVAPMSLNSARSSVLTASLWMPVSRADLQPNSGAGVQRGLLEDRENLFLQVRARLREGVSIEQARAAMNVTARRIAADHPDAGPKRGITVIATDDVHIHPRERFLKPAATAGLTIVGLVLAIACSNLATLLLVRSSARAAEISVRLALGATRAQLMRHLLMESLILSLAGAAIGVLLAHWGLRYLSAIDMPVVVAMQLDYRVLGFAAVAAALCGAGFGLTPAIRATRMDVAGALRDEKGSSGNSLSLSRGWFTMKNVLVAGQVAASFMLLVSAAAAMSVLNATQSRGVGYRVDGLGIVETDPRYAGYDLLRAKAALEEVRRRIAALPGVESAFVTTGFPVDGQFEKEFLVEVAKGGETVRVEGRWSGPGYFQTLGIPVLYGRVFDERDSPESPAVIVVSEAFARKFFGGSDAVGKQLRFAEPGAGPVEIVGVVGNSRSVDMVEDAPKTFFYRPAAQGAVMPTTIVVRTTGHEDALPGLMQQEIRRLHPELPVMSATTMRQRQAKELGLFRTAAGSLSVLGGLGLLLAAVGLYAVVAYAVSQRTNELGIRVALGAGPGNLTWLVVRDVTGLVVAGIAIGSALAWAGVTVFESSLGQVAGINAWVLVPVGVLIVPCGAAAAYFPVRRAILADPVAAIRYQ